MSFVRCFRSATGFGSLLAVSAVLLPGAACCAEKPPVPAVRIPLSALGFPGYTLALMRAGASMAAIHMLDDRHALFTFSLRSLVPRLAGDDANDSDRVVAAELVELPTGKVLARTEWHLHDHGRYLWKAGQGLYVLRIGQELSLFAPLRGLERGEAFQRVALPHRPGVPQLVESSPDGRILMVQMQHPEEQTATVEAGEEEPHRKRTTVEFYRLAETKTEKQVQLQPAGVVGSTGFLRLALDGDGYLWAEDQHHGQWAVSFNEYEGKPQSLATVHSACAPTLRLLSRSQFAALSCRNDDSPELLVYGFDGHENWEEPFGQTLQAPTFAMAPEAGRFAFSRFYASDGTAGSSPEGPLSEEIRVYQTESGDLLLHLQCDPVARTAENFDLSSDGHTLAVLGSKSLDLYRLPDLTERDRKELAEVASMRPPESAGPVILRRITRPIREGAAETEQAAGAEETTAAGAATTAAAAAPVEASGAKTGSGTGLEAAVPGTAGQGGAARASRGDETVANRDAGEGAAAGEAPRKPPTLLNPGEAPEFKGPKSTPQ